MQMSVNCRPAPRRPIRSNNALISPISLPIAAQAGQASPWVTWSASGVQMPLARAARSTRGHDEEARERQSMGKEGRT